MGCGADGRTFTLMPMPKKAARFVLEFEGLQVFRYGICYFAQEH
jgi:hypothetical protein